MSSDKNTVTNRQTGCQHFTDGGRRQVSLLCTTREAYDCAQRYQWAAYMATVNTKNTRRKPAGARGSNTEGTIQDKTAQRREAGCSNRCARVVAVGRFITERFCSDGCHRFCG